MGKGNFDEEAQEEKLNAYREEKERKLQAELLEASGA